MAERDITAELADVRRELTMIRQEVVKVVNAINEAESEIPEKMRRFMNYFHDVRDIRYMHEEHGHAAPPWIDREIERLYDRYRQLLVEMNAEGGVFNKVRREMADDPLNRYDHTKQLPKPKEKSSETR